jgi:hypothetical protein
MVDNLTWRLLVGSRVQDDCTAASEDLVEGKEVGPYPMYI